MNLRVAVHPGAATTRVAVADPRPRLVAELPGQVHPDAAVALLFGRPVTPTATATDRRRHGAVAMRRGVRRGR